MTTANNILHRNILTDATQYFASLTHFAPLLAQHNIVRETNLGRSPGEPHHVRRTACGSFVIDEARRVTVLGPFRYPEVIDPKKTERTNKCHDVYHSGRSCSRKQNERNSCNGGGIVKPGSNEHDVAVPTRCALIATPAWPVTPLRLERDTYAENK